MRCRTAESLEFKLTAKLMLLFARKTQRLVIIVPSRVLLLLFNSNNRKSA